ncbi:hypothetical protein LEP1GSC193_3850 [Leptospira alstonii serovar Pingchang str. 80-412]|uniref:Uncharacterized protein n=2 Tax=Leptospira alstonii TaxID=28452 RepID=M6CUR6_9LEPT|nr:hypothetical protein LEP1GSC194_2369 [Leptospira alstonii serovar Sichuan str. 79601]EQA80614.1 hypothetical protein LEP1GSC193_3850 [Leptospira alstonii serovar Pingchang str. 80-412]
MRKRGPAQTSNRRIRVYPFDLKVEYVMKNLKFVKNISFFVLNNRFISRE